MSEEHIIRGGVFKMRTEVPPSRGLDMPSMIQSGGFRVKDGKVEFDKPGPWELLDSPPPVDKL